MRLATERSQQSVGHIVDPAVHSGARARFPSVPHNCGPRYVAHLLDHVELHEAAFGVRVASSRDRAGGGLALGQTRASAQTRPSGEWHETGQAMDTERRPSSCALQESVRCRLAGSGPAAS